jgi:hypothetical protein
MKLYTSISFLVWSEETQSNAYQVKLVVSQYIKGDMPLVSGKLDHF